MTKNEIYETIDTLKQMCDIEIDSLILSRILNYIEANIDEFIECYEEIDKGEI